MTGTPSFLDRHTISFKRSFMVSTERLWAAVSTKQELDVWFMETDLELRVNGQYTFKDGWDGWISELKPFECIQCDSSEVSYTRFDLESQGKGTLLTVTDRLKPDLIMDKQENIWDLQPGGPGTHWVGIVAGWHDFLEALEAHIYGNPVQDHYHELCLFYADFLKQHYGDNKNL